MTRWFLVTFLGLLLINGLWPLLSRFGFGRLPGDFRFTVMGRPICLPIASALLLSFLLSLLERWL